jgi:putative chitinase
MSDRPQVIDAAMLSEGTNIPRERAEVWAPLLSEAMEVYEIDSHLRRAAFIAQCAHESAFFKRWVEDMTYRTAEGIRNTFGSRMFPTVNAAQTYVGNPVLLANYVYDDRNRSAHSRLGNTEPGDGARFIGRGLLQITGRYNYQRASEALEEDFVTFPDMLLEPRWASLSAAWFFSDRGCNEAADTGEIDKVTRIINPGMLARGERERIFRDVLHTLIV